jgi:hypothetical protein
MSSGDVVVADAALSKVWSSAASSGGTALGDVRPSVCDSPGRKSVARRATLGRSALTSVVWPSHGPQTPAWERRWP